MKNPILIMILLVSLILSFTVVAVLLAVSFDSDAPLSVLVMAVAIISFFGLLALSNSEDKPWRFTEASLRSSIAGSIVIEYLVLVGVVAFFKEGPNQLPAISQTLITNFTAIVGVVIAFYFGSSAIIQVKTPSDNEKIQRNEGEQPSEHLNKPPNPTQ